MDAIMLISLEEERCSFLTYKGSDMNIQQLSRSALLLSALLLAGCHGTPHASHRRAPDLKPAQYQLLTDDEKLRYKDVVVRVPESMGGVLLPFDAGPYLSATEKAVHGGDLNTLAGLYNQSLFELQHTRVKIEYINFDMWSGDFQSALAVALSASRAPAYYVARDLPHTIEQGMYADLTPLIRTWDQFSRQPESTVREGTLNGHIYTISGHELSALVIRYRKDWFQEAGILDENGKPGPPKNWTWEDFRRIAQKLTDPKRNRFGFAGQTDDFLYNAAHDLDLYIPDPAGRHTWIFNDHDPEMLRSLQAAREMYAGDRSISASVSTGWTEWHSEFDASHAAMIVSWAAHIPRESLESPEKFGNARPYTETVGMAVPPHDGMDLTALRPLTDPIGFDPTLTPEQLKAAFEWYTSYLYGDIFVNRMRNDTAVARLNGRRSTLYSELLALPYQPAVNLLDQPLDKVFPGEYLDVYTQIRACHAVPLPREFGLLEPPANDLQGAMKAMYSEAITGNVDLKELLQRTANLINTTLLNFGGKEDHDKLLRYVDARSEFYRRYYPHYYAKAWPEKRQKYFQIPQ
jgi:ABC-type glycerol-3-phosphate transport system substrate-binding protein